MNSNSNQVSKRLKTETSFEVQTESSPMEVDDAASHGSQVTISKDGVSTLPNIFTDDILPGILDNLDILTTTDLLRFRLVSRCWRDAATSVLLKRNLCRISLYFNKVHYNHHGYAFGCSEFEENACRCRESLTIPPADYKYFSLYKSSLFLSDLNELIYNSPKFPCKRFRFDTMTLFGFGTLSPPTELNDANQNQQDLFRFFSLHGKNIEEMQLGGQISKTALNKLLYVHMPHLKCLHLGEYSFREEDTDEKNMSVFFPPPLTLEIKEIVWKYDKKRSAFKTYAFEKELISVCPNLSSIENVDVEGLDFLLQIEKSHLIQDLVLYPDEDDQILPVLQFSKLLMGFDLKGFRRLIKLKRLDAEFDEYKEELAVLIKALSIILSASKNTLKDLDFWITPLEFLGNLFIPPLPRLESLSLRNFESDEEALFNIKVHFRGDVIGEAIRAGQIAADESIHGVNALASKNHPVSSNIPAQYFPRLRKVKIEVDEMKNKFSQKLMGFFSVEHLEPSSSVITTPSDTLISVTTLIWKTSLEHPPYDNVNMSKLFPNVKNLKIVCSNTGNFPNWVWTFPKLESCEISGLPQNQGNTKIVDSFFTGFSQEFCASFKVDDAITKSEAHSAKAFERTRPYVGSCTNLKELRIQFREKLNSKFASKLTAVYGFQDVIHRTKILFCFNALLFTEEEIREQSQYLESVAAYVEIRECYDCLFSQFVV